MRSVPTSAAQFLVAEKQQDSPKKTQGQEAPVNPENRNAAAVEGAASRMLQEVQAPAPSAGGNAQYFLKDPSSISRREASRDDLSELLARHSRHEGLAQAVFGGEAGKRLSSHRLAEALMTAGDYKRALPLLQDQLDMMKQIGPADQLQEHMNYRRTLVIRDMTEAIERTQGEKAARDFFFKEMKEVKLAHTERRMYETLSRGENLSGSQIADLTVLLQSSSDPLSAGKRQWLRNATESYPVLSESGQYTHPSQNKELLEHSEALLENELKEEFEKSVNKPDQKGPDSSFVFGETGEQPPAPANRAFDVMIKQGNEQSFIDVPPIEYSAPTHEEAPPSQLGVVNDYFGKTFDDTFEEPRLQPDHKAIAEDVSCYFGRLHPYVVEELTKAADSAKADGNDRLALALSDEARIITEGFPKLNKSLNEALMMYGSATSAEFAVRLSLVAEEFADAGDIAMAYKISFATVGMLESVATNSGDYTRIIGMHNQLARFSEGKESTVKYHQRKAQEWAQMRDRK